MNLPQQIKQFISIYCRHSNDVVIALSGGLDSVVLLDLLTKSTLKRSQLKAVYVDHGLSSNARQWGEFCQKLCACYQIGFTLERVKLTDNQRNIEAGARDARYAALSTHINQNSILVTAQHSDDQAETLLLALKRGSGVLGLSAMPQQLAFGLGYHCRPLLNVTRVEIESYAAINGLEWVEDESNQDSRFDRNYLRNQVLPRLNQRWHGFNKNIARSAELLGQASELLDDLAVLDLAHANLPPHSLSITQLHNLSGARQSNLIRYWLRQQQLAPPSQAQLQQVLVQILASAADSDPIVSIADYHIRRYRDAMVVVGATNDVSSVVLTWHGQKEIELPDQLGRLEVVLSVDGCCDNRVDLIAPQSQKVEIRFEVVGSYKAWPVGREKRRAVKKLWQEFNVPTWQRARTPLVFFDQQLVAALGIWVEQGYQYVNTDSSQVGLHISWHKN